MLFLEILNNSPSWTAFFGRFHPLIVHLPIGFLLTIIILEILKLYDKISFHNSISKLILSLASLSAIFSCLLGYLLSLEGGYEEELLEEHKIQGIILAIFTTLAWIIKIDFFSKRLSKYNVIYFPVLLLNLFLLILTGHHGGNLTHGETYLFDKMPFFSSEKNINEETQQKNITIKSSKDLENAVVYTTFIQPIIAEKCTKCHSASKIKGKLRLDTFELMMKGGEHKNTIIANNSESSELIKRILLPENNDDHMPPADKPQISENELSLLRWWINNGAKKDATVQTLPRDSAVNKILNSLIVNNGLVSEVNFITENEILKKDISEISENKFTELKTKGFIINKISQNSNYIEVICTNKSKQNLNLLDDVSSNILWLKINLPSVNALNLSTISNFINLTRLNLENSDLSDDAFSKLNSLQNLEYLNLVNTKVTDNSIPKLGSFKQLKKIYIWNSKITPEGFESLKNLLPKTKIDFGMSSNDISKLKSLIPDSISDDIYSSKKK